MNKDKLEHLLTNNFDENNPNIQQMYYTYMNKIIDSLEYDFVDDILIDDIEDCKLQVNEILEMVYNEKLERVLDDLKLITHRIENDDFIL